MSIVKSAKLWQKKKFDWPKISKTSQIALGEKIFRKKNSRNYPRFHAGNVRKKLWSHFMQ